MFFEPTTSRHEVLEVLRSHQTVDDRTVEYFCSDVWSVSELTAYTKDIELALLVCTNWVDDDGEVVAPGTEGAYEPDGTYEEQTTNEWWEHLEVIEYIRSARKRYRKWTEADWAYIAGGLDTNPR